MNESIRYLTHNQIDKRQWDHCIESSINRKIYACSWYLDIVAGEWDALVEGDYNSVFPLPYRQKAGIKYLYQPPFTQQLGIFSKNLLTVELVNSYLKCIPAFFKLIEINFNTLNRFTETGFSLTTNSNFELDLISPYEDLAKRYSENLKRNLKKASKSNISLINSPEIRDIIRIFEQNKGKDISVFRRGEYTILMNLMKKSIDSGIVSVKGVLTSEGKLCAGAFFLEHFNRSIFLFSATDTKAKEVSAMPFLIDDHIRKFAGIEHTLDFEGSNNADLARFYKSFGSVECNYFSISRNTRSNLHKFAFKLYKKYR